MGRQLLRVSLIGRLLALATLVVALLDPPLPWRNAPLDIYLLLDESVSMPSEGRDRAWKQIMALGDSLATGDRFNLIRFGGRSFREIEDMEFSSETFQALAGLPPPRTEAVIPDRSDLEQALRTALVSLDPGRRSLIVMATDGMETTGQLDSALRAAGMTGATVAWMPPRNNKSDKPISINALQVQDIALSGEKLPVTININSAEQSWATLSLILNEGSRQEKAMQLQQGTNAAHFEVELPDVGIHLVEAAVSTRGPTSELLDNRSALVRATGLSRILALTNPTVSTPFLVALETGGWRVRRVAPADFQQSLLRDTDVILVDDLPASSLSDADWLAIGRAVEFGGTGLIVLGGPHSFGGGAYRHGILESLLPVTSQSRQPQDPAAVLFVLDRSGSMDQEEDSRYGSRMAIARRAIARSAALLEAGDWSGLLAFDAETEVILPLGQHTDAEPWIAGTQAQTPQGGTRLAPALRQAIDMLSQAPQQQRLIVLVSDGYVEQQADYGKLAARLESADIDLVVIAIGREAAENPTLSLLANRNDGGILVVDELVRLPRLMSDEILKRRSVVAQGPVTPVNGFPVGFRIPGTPAWPVVDSYMVTLEKADAVVHLKAHSGDPLLASWFLGNGRVVALPAGLGEWTGAWTEWQGWDTFVGGLVEWTGRIRGDPGLHVYRPDRQNARYIDVDVATAEQMWESSTAVSALVTDPAMKSSPAEVTILGPGHYRVLIPATQRGRYDIQFKAGSRTVHHALFHEPVTELNPAPSQRESMQAALERGDIRMWQPAHPLNGLPDIYKDKGSRQLWLIMALLMYLGTLIAERDFRISWLSKTRARNLTRWFLDLAQMKAFTRLSNQ